MFKIFTGVLLSHNAQNYPTDLAALALFTQGYVTMVRVNPDTFY